MSRKGYRRWLTLTTRMLLVMCFCAGFVHSVDVYLPQDEVTVVLRNGRQLVGNYNTATGDFYQEGSRGSVMHVVLSLDDVIKVSPTDRAIAARADSGGGTSASTVDRTAEAEIAKRTRLLATQAARFRAGEGWTKHNSARLNILQSAVIVAMTATSYFKEYADVDSLRDSKVFDKHSQQNDRMDFSISRGHMHIEASYLKGLPPQGWTRSFLGEVRISIPGSFSEKDLRDYTMDLATLYGLKESEYKFDRSDVVIESVLPSESDALTLVVGDKSNILYYPQQTEFQFYLKGPLIMTVYSSHISKLLSVVQADIRDDLVDALRGIRR